MTNFITGTAANDTLNGIADVSNVIDGLAGNDTLIGNNMADSLIGGLGVDTLTGGAGNDSYVVDSIDDVVIESSTLATEIDIVQSSVTYVLSANVEMLTLTGNGETHAVGNDLANTLTGNDAANILNGGQGADTMIGGLGNDLYAVDDANDIIIETSTLATEIDTVQASVSYTLSANIEALSLTGTSAINGTGNSSANTLTGNDVANILDGGSGVDSLIGGLGNDTYVIDNVGDIVVETSTLATEIDVILASISYSLGTTNVEALTLTGTAAINGTGNRLANTLIGNSAANILDGGLNTDTMIGGLGNDTYIVDSIIDVVVETSTLATEIDVVQASVSYTLGANLDTLVLTGALAINGTGNSLANDLTGNGAANMLNGGIGADTLIGGLGNDTYVIDNIGDTVVETSTLATEIDVIQASISYTLGANLEALVLTGNAVINGTGNSLANILTGNSAANLLTGGQGNDTLTGGLGTDTLVGGLGNDVYIVDDTTDVLTESSTVTTEIDVVQSSASYTLGANIETLILTGTAAINATGNGLANTLIGNDANNLLTGGLGADTLQGGLGYDIYSVDNINDVVLDSAVQNGQDVIRSSVSFSLVGSFVETLALTGSAANATGDDLDNTLYGNNANNILTGAAGNDLLAGGLGSDTYVVGRGSAQDTVSENDSRVANNTDVISFLSSVANDQLWFSHVADNLQITIIGTSDQVTINNWYLGSSHHVEQIKTVDGNKVLLDSHVENLVAAMASLTPPPLGQMTLTTAEHIALDSVIAANWS